ncbi:MAG: molybdopterin cofactor-binding domain-containing protein, partial [Bacteroidota bacterium]
MSEKKTKGVSRRKFLVRGGLGALGIMSFGTCVLINPLRRGALGVTETMIPPYSGTGTAANLWFEITESNQVIFHSSKVEMGQGTFTGLAQIVADELDINVENIIVKVAETATGIVDRLSTGGSLSIASLWQPLREMAATMRETIKAAAAQQMGVDVASLTTQNGVVQAGARSMTYAEVAAQVETWKISKTPALRPVSDYKFVGKPVKRVDLNAKVLGDPIFGMDASMPDMLHATVVRPIHIGASLKSADISEAEKMPGVVKIVQQEDWIGVIADSFTQALAAKNKIKVEWNIPKEWT